MALIAELDQSLEALRALKPPGVSKSKVASITNLFVENIQVLHPCLLGLFILFLFFFSFGLTRFLTDARSRMNTF